MSEPKWDWKRLMAVRALTILEQHEEVCFWTHKWAPPGAKRIYRRRVASWIVCRNWIMWSDPGNDDVSFETAIARLNRFKSVRVSAGLFGGGPELL